MPLGQDAIKKAARVNAGLHRCEFNILRHFCGLKGHESIAQALAWVYISNGPALKGRQKIVLNRRGILNTLDQGRTC